jgi:hypothetical protein
MVAADAVREDDRGALAVFFIVELDPVHAGVRHSDTSSFKLRSRYLDGTGR